MLRRYAAIPCALHFAKVQVRTPEDIKGIKMIALGVSAKALQSMGASPVVLDPPDWYMALDRGVVEGICTAHSTIHDHKVVPLLPYHIDMDLAYLGREVIMNLDA